MWNTRIVWRVFQVPLKFFMPNYYIFIVCVQSFASAVQSDSVRRPIGLRSPSNRIPSAVGSDVTIQFRPSCNQTKNPEVIPGIFCIGMAEVV